VGFQVSRIEVAPDPLVPSSYDYADAFTIRLDAPDAHRAEEWVRTGLEQSGGAVRGLIRFVHGRVARFELFDGPGTILGWRVLRSEDDVLHMRTEGPLLRAEIVARRTSESAAGFTTFLFYKRRGTPALWLVIGPLHRRVAPYLLRRAAVRLTG
jgi:hypothetical protein